jgi:hypothetical protein
MPKFSEGQVAIGLLALFAFWLFVVLPIMFAQSEYWTIAEHELKITDTLVAVFTALLFFATLLLFFATRALVLGAEKTAERQLRAYVFAQVDCLKRVDNDWRCERCLASSANICEIKQITGKEATNAKKGRQGAKAAVAEA